MPKFSNKLAFVVPTKDHPQLLRDMLASLARQSYLPDQVIVVDGGDQTVEEIVNEFPTLRTRYVRVYPPSLAKQRNAGMAVVESDITVAGYLDDDLILEPDAVEAMMEFWEMAPPDIGGSRFNVINDRLPQVVWAKTMFSLDSPRRGAVLPSGNATPVGPIAENQYVDWLSGGATCWRMEVVKEFLFDEWFVGTGYLEDLDYSYRVRKKYRLVAVANARLHHFSSPVRSDMNYVLGKWQVVNRMYFIKKNPELSRPLFYWSTLGELLFNFGAAVAKGDPGRLKRAWGNCVGMTMIARGRLDRIGGVYK